MVHFTCARYAGDSVLYVGNNVGKVDFEVRVREVVMPFFMKHSRDKKNSWEREEKKGISKRGVEREKRKSGEYRSERKEKRTN